MKVRWEEEEEEVQLSSNEVPGFRCKPALTDAARGGCDFVVGFVLVEKLGTGSKTDGKNGGGWGVDGVVKIGAVTLS